MNPIHAKAQMLTQDNPPSQNTFILDSYLVTGGKPRVILHQIWGIL